MLAHWLFRVFGPFSVYFFRAGFLISFPAPCLFKYFLFLCLAVSLRSLFSHPPTTPFHFLSLTSSYNSLSLSFSAILLKFLISFFFCHPLNNSLSLSHKIYLFISFLCGLVTNFSHSFEHFETGFSEKFEKTKKKKTWQMLVSDSAT